MKKTGKKPKNLDKNFLEICKRQSQKFINEGENFIF